MSIDEAIKHSEEVAEKYERHLKIYENMDDDLFRVEKNECKNCAKEHRQLAGWLKELKQLREQTRWIPVSERLPEIDEDGYSSYVLVSFSNFTLPCIGQLRKTDGENHWYEGDDEKALDRFGLHVNAWMPLPEPYKEESEE